MPTPDHIRQESLRKRARLCTICGSAFVVRKADRKGSSCSPACLAILRRQNASGRPQSAETIAKRAAANREAWADSKANEVRRLAISTGVKAWHAEPSNAERFAKRSSDRMKALHADPDWQKIRDKRSSVVMKQNWQKHRDLFVQQAIERFHKSALEGSGLNSDESKKLSAQAAKWIFKRAQAALHSETDYDAIFTEVQARLRRERPFDGDESGADYFDYLRQLCRDVVMSPECRILSDTFMASAIPRFSDEWQRNKRQCRELETGNAT